jgi:hypothetical protein
MAKSKAAANLFTVSLTVAGETYKATDKTVIAALNKINPAQMKARGLFVVTHDGKRSERQMFPLQIRKLLINETFKQIFEKQMVSTLK